MSDAVNLLVYVGLPDDCDAQENIKLVLQQVIHMIIKLFGCFQYQHSTGSYLTVTLWFFGPGQGPDFIRIHWSKCLIAFWVMYNTF